jgi:hypothetical protein
VELGEDFEKYQQKAHITTRYQERACALNLVFKNELEG